MLQLHGKLITNRPTCVALSIPHVETRASFQTWQLSCTCSLICMQGTYMQLCCHATMKLNKYAHNLGHMSSFSACHASANQPFEQVHRATSICSFVAVCCTICLLKWSVSTVQLSSKVTFARVSDAFHTRSGRAHRLAKKGRGTRVRLVAALLQGFALAWTRLTCVPDASCTRFRRVRTLPWS